MADIATSDVTYTLQGHNARRKDDGLRREVVKIVFGDGVLTYPAGGIPLLRASMNASNEIVELVIMDAASANGLVYKYDYENEKIRIYEGDYAQAGDAPLVELDAASDTPAEATLYVAVAGW